MGDSRSCGEPTGPRARPRADRGPGRRRAVRRVATVRRALARLLRDDGARRRAVRGRDLAARLRRRGARSLADGSLAAPAASADLARDPHARARLRRARARRGSPSARLACATPLPGLPPRGAREKARKPRNSCDARHWWGASSKVARSANSPMGQRRRTSRSCGQSQGCARRRRSVTARRSAARAAVGRDDGSSRRSRRSGPGPWPDPRIDRCPRRRTLPAAMSVYSDL